MQGRDIAVHREDAVGRNQRASMTLPQFCDQRVRVRDIGVTIRHDRRAREASAGP